MFLSKAQIINLRHKIAKWDVQNPVDLLWRKHFNIPFGSKEHLEADVFEQMMWYIEMLEIRKIEERVDKGEDQDGGIIDNGELSDEEFDNLDISELKE